MAERPIQQIDIERIFLYEQNPRHEPLEGQDEIIAHLCRDEQVFNLARSIAQRGTNPLEILGVVEAPGSSKLATKKTYEVWEGNRRVCAIQLLNDPDRAPPHLRKDFGRLVSENKYKPITRIPSVAFTDHGELKFWMGVIHGGQQDGIGRKTWDAGQKERHVGTGRNKVALAVLDYAETIGLISKDERPGKLTTAQRYLNSSVVREALGIDATNKEDITYNRPIEDIKTQVSRFIGDLKKGAKVHSRSNKEQIDSYGRQLAKSADITGERTQPLSLKVAQSSSGKKRTTENSKKQKQPRDHLEYDKELSEAVDLIDNEKLESLYASLTTVRLAANTPLLAVGLWAFVESLAAMLGKASEVNFPSFFSATRCANLGFTDKKKLQVIWTALDRISKDGNATKHHYLSAVFNGKQLNNDLKVVTPLLTKAVQDHHKKHHDI